jgi:hypothetical protein
MQMKSTPIRPGSARSDAGGGDAGSDDAPRPVPPERPGPDDCCRGACDPCIFEIYEEALERYRAQLRAWEERQARTKAGGARPAGS